MGTDADSSALVRLLQQLGRSQCTLSPQGLVVFLTEASHSLKSANNQGDGCQLSFGVTDLILIERECLIWTKYGEPREEMKRLRGWNNWKLEKLRYPKL